MRIHQVDVYPLHIPYKATFSISRGIVGGGNVKRTVVVVKITDTDGCTGWGEGSPSHLWSSETIETVVAVLRRHYIPAIIGHPIHDIAGMHDKLDHVVGSSFSIGHPIAKCSIDTAMHDLLSKSTGVGLGSLWGCEQQNESLLSWTISANNLTEAERILEQGCELGYSNVNIKLGVNEIFDVAICRKVRKRLPESLIWGDANGAYSFTHALKIIPQLQDAGLDILEQPIPSNQMRNWHELKRQIRIPLAADEPIVSTRDLLEWIRQDLITAFAMKVTRNGGLYPSRVCMEISRAAPLITVCSGLTETGLGLAANLHLACAFGIQTPCAWNGPQFLADDILQTPLNIKDGKVRLPQGLGMGVTVDEEKLKYYRFDL